MKNIIIQIKKFEKIINNYEEITQKLIVNIDKRIENKIIEYFGIKKNKRYEIEKNNEIELKDKEESDNSNENNISYEELKDYKNNKTKNNKIIKYSDYFLFLFKREDEMRKIYENYKEIEEIEKMRMIKTNNKGIIKYYLEMNFKDRKKMNILKIKNGQYMGKWKKKNPEIEEEIKNGEIIEEIDNTNKKEN